VLGAVAAQKYGFPPAFEMLGGLSLGSLIIWLAFASMLCGAGRITGFVDGIVGTQSAC
jgi:hypothetical protein